MTPCRRKSSREERECPFWDFRDVLIYEKERSERHNRFFVVCGLRLSAAYSEDLLAEIRAQLRASDYILPMPQYYETQMDIGILLPETDLQGAQTVRKRLSFLFSIKAIEFQFEMAVYPDDATVPDRLLDLVLKDEKAPGLAQVVI